MHRCYHPNVDWGRPIQRVEGEEAQHALKVLRLREGDVCQLFDGLGHRCDAQIIHTEGFRAMELRLQGERCCTGLEGDACITLALAIPKGSNMDLIVQKAVELGVRRIIPLLTQRTIVRLKEREFAAKREKWQRTILEACKQCGVDVLPEIECACCLDEFLSSSYEGRLVCCALVDGALPMRDILERARADQERRVLLLIGPEGDFSPDEYARIQERGFEMASLGRIILRVETAVFMAIAQASYAIR